LTLHALAFGIFCGAIVRAAALAEEPPPPLPARITRLSDREVDQRLAYLEEHLDAGRDYAWWWWNGWTAFYATGVVVESTRAGLADGGATRADDIVGAVKATGGVVGLLLRPLEAKEGADGVRPQASLSPADRRRLLFDAEERLKRNRDATKRRYSWKRHALNVGINTAGALIVWQGYGDPSRAWRSAGIGIAVGEAMIWSQPSRPADEWEEYQRRFDTSAAEHVSWHITPTLGGMALRVDF
jgi:hypothetical protein